MVSEASPWQLPASHSIDHHVTPSFPELPDAAEDGHPDGDRNVEEDTALPQDHAPIKSHHLPIALPKPPGKQGERPTIYFVLIFKDDWFQMSPCLFLSICHC